MPIRCALRQILTLLVGGCALLAAAADPAPPKPVAPLPGAVPQVHTIVMLGDSLTAGYGLDPGQAYPALIQKALTARGWPWKVVDAGRSGDTSLSALKRLDWVLGPQRTVDILVIALGGNDALRGLKPEDMSKNLAAIITQARKKFPSVKIVLAGMLAPPELGKEYTDAFAAVYPALAAEHKVTLLPFLLEGVAGQEALNQPDRIHPNVAGAQRVADTVFQVLVPLIRPSAAARP